jgi:vacuolar-type H+-ATPase subunit E/Vma4
MASDGATRQIRQMVDFIMLEAREKAHEIRTKVCAW